MQESISQQLGVILALGSNPTFQSIVLPLTCTVSLLIQRTLIVVLVGSMAFLAYALATPPVGRGARICLQALIRGVFLPPLWESSSNAI